MLNCLKKVWSSFQVGSCSFKLARNHPALLSIFITDLTLYYLLPLLLSVILYVLIGKTLLSKSRNRLPGGGTRSSSLSTTAALKANQSRVQVGTFLEFSSISGLLLLINPRNTAIPIIEDWDFFFQSSGTFSGPIHPDNRKNFILSLSNTRTCLFLN